MKALAFYYVMLAVLFSVTIKVAEQQDAVRTHPLGGEA